MLHHVACLVSHGQTAVVCGIKESYFFCCCWSLEQDIDSIMVLSGRSDHHLDCQVGLSSDSLDYDIVLSFVNVSVVSA